MSLENWGEILEKERKKTTPCSKCVIKYIHLAGCLNKKYVFLSQISKKMWDLVVSVSFFYTFAPQSKKEYDYAWKRKRKKNIIIAVGEREVWVCSYLWSSSCRKDLFSARNIVIGPNRVPFLLELKYSQKKPVNTNKKAQIIETHIPGFE